MKVKCFGFILAEEDYAKFEKTHRELIKEVSLSFEKIYIINVSALKFRNNNYTIKNENLLPKNFVCINILSSIQFLKFFKDKKFIAIQYLDKNPDFFKIFFLIKLANIKNIMIMNMGNFGVGNTINFNPKYIFAFKYYYMKGFYRIFRILTILNIFPKIDLLFEANSLIVDSINNGWMKKLEKKLPFLKISYFQKIEKINSLFYDNYIINKNFTFKNKNNILFVDVPINHGDRTLREAPADDASIKNYYSNLRFFLTRMSEMFELNVIIGVHPSSSDVNQFFSDFNISTQRTMDLIPGSEIIVVTHSSLISMMAIYKKKIISIRSKHLGKFHTDLSEKYSNSLQLFKVNIDSNFIYNKQFILNSLNNSISYYDDYILKYINSDGDNLSNKTIVKKIKQNFFY